MPRARRSPTRLAPSRFAVAIACSPATPAPSTSTRAGARVPAAVIVMPNIRPKASAASVTSRYPASSACDDSTSIDCAREMRGSRSSAIAVMPASRAAHDGIGVLERIERCRASRLPAGAARCPPPTAGGRGAGCRRHGRARFDDRRAGVAVGGIRDQRPDTRAGLRSRRSHRRRRAFGRSRGSRRRASPPVIARRARVRRLPRFLTPGATASSRPFSES